MIEKVQENANFKVWGFCDTSPGLGQCVCVFGSEGGHGNPLWYSCLENPTDRGAWQVTVHMVTMSQTRLERLSTHKQTIVIIMSYFFVTIPSP